MSLANLRWVKVDSDPSWNLVKTEKLTQRCSKPSFFLMNKTSVPYKEEVGWIKHILRFFLMNSLRASCLDAEREYIGPIRD